MSFVSHLADSEVGSSVSQEIVRVKECGVIKEVARSGLYKEQQVKEMALGPTMQQPQGAVSLAQVFSHNAAAKEEPADLYPKQRSPVANLMKFKNLSCDICGQIFDKIAPLVTHIVENHSKDETDDNETDRKTVVAKTRPSASSRKQLARSRGNYMVHKLFPKSKKPLTCDVCKKGFTGRSHLVAHMDTHIEKKRYSCDGCKREFEKKEYLILHMQTPKVYNPAACDFCGKKFSSFSHLTVHRLMHSRYETLRDM